MSDEKKPLDEALDLFVYAPLGFALSLRDLLPQMASRGRQTVTNQTQMAKVMGQFAVQMGHQQAEKKLREARGQADEVLQSFLPGNARPGHVPPAPPAASTNGSASTQTSAPVSTTPVAEPAPRPKPTAPAVSSLAIPGYDTLSASQVVQRLGGLSADELQAVAAYEQAGRGRKTILNKIAQLQSAG